MIFGLFNFAGIAVDIIPFFQDGNLGYQITAINALKDNIVIDDKIVTAMDN